LGLALFAIYNHQLTGDYLAFTKIQSAWNRTLNNPISTLIGAIRRGLAQEKIRPLIEASFSIGAIALLLGFFRKFQVSYWLFSLYSIFIPLLTGIDSMPRYLLPIFPLYILIAQLTRNPELDQVYTILFALLQGGLSIFWFCGYNLLV
jgi:vacuolar-type H+-ATPase subunit I/STV1